jgi:nicotinate (nicotinamide) nucleotide adenylyltransferase
MIYIFGGAFDPAHVWHTAIIRALFYYKNPEKIVLMPSGARNDKSYSASDEHRLAMLEIFCQEIKDERVIIDDYFVREWEWEMITEDVDKYAKEKYGVDIVHIFWTDTVPWMNEWDSTWYAAKVCNKIFVPRLDGQNDQIGMTDEIIAWYGIENFEMFLETTIPPVSSTEIRKLIPEYSTQKAYHEEDPRFIIPGLSKRISAYIRDQRLYLPKLDKKPRILVHVCCGPDATMPIMKLRAEYDVICFWYDPNIQPKSEHDKRYEAFVKVCEIENIPYIKGAYDVKNFFTRIKGLEHTPEKGEKCTNCYDMRMYVSAKLAKRLKIPFYTSSLNTSPKKDLEKLFQMWHKYAEDFWIEFLDVPFRKRGGFEASVDYTKEHDIFRQSYCGCIYSVRDGGESDLKNRIVW